ncbi:MAG TPA: hypothetical protein VFX96_17985 [Pyrinomonadaceae bacterium]|nr:hypothetical protein [Pyrinomonadaceae bacterium]
MNESNNIDGVRRAALDRIDRSERNYRLAFYGAALLEALFLAGYLLLADFSERLHLLLFLATVATYTLVALGLLALGAHTTRGNLRVLRAVEALEERLGGGRR